MRRIKVTRSDRLSIFLGHFSPPAWRFSEGCGGQGRGRLPGNTLPAAGPWSGSRPLWRRCGRSRRAGGRKTAASGASRVSVRLEKRHFQAQPPAKTQLPQLESLWQARCRVLSFMRRVNSTLADTEVFPEIVRLRLAGRPNRGPAGRRVFGGRPTCSCSPFHRGLAVAPAVHVKRTGVSSRGYPGKAFSSVCETRTLSLANHD